MIMKHANLALLQTKYNLSWQVTGHQLASGASLLVPYRVRMHYVHSE